MNRRHRKKQQTSSSLKQMTQQFLHQWAAIDWRSYAKRLAQYPIWLRLKFLWGQLPVYHQRGLMVLIPVVVLLLFLPSSPQQDASTRTAAPASTRVSIAVNTQGLSEQSVDQPTTVTISAIPQEKAWQEYIIKQGDTLSQVFRSNNLPLADLNALVGIEGSDKPLSQIQQGQRIRFKLAVDGQLDILQLERNNQSVMFFRLSDGGFGRSQ